MIGAYGKLLKQAETDVLLRMQQTGHALMPVAIMLKQLAEDVETCVVYNRTQAQRISAILDAVTEIMPPEERNRITSMIPPAPSSPEDYLLSRLQNNLDRWKDALTAAHAWLESAADPARDGLLDEIWSYLASEAQHEGRFVGQIW